MTALNLLKVFDRRPADHALVATFDFDPVFFERRLLRTRSFGGARRILVLMDAGRYGALLKEGLTAAEFGRRYLVLPVSRREGVVHSKVYLMLGRQTLWGVVGSSNCTQPGIAYNMELGSAFEADPDRDGADSASAHHLVQAAYHFVRRLGEHAGPHAASLDEAFFGPIEQAHPLLHRGVLEATVGSAPTVELLDTLDEGLWPQLVRRLEGRKVRRVAVLSPFFDLDTGLFERLQSTWPPANVVILTQQEYGQLPAARLEAWCGAARGYRLELRSVTPPPGRRLHAKALAFETDAGTFWLAGSANFTAAALDGRNVETCLWFGTAGEFEGLFADDALRVESIALADFRPGQEEAPGPIAAGSGPLLTLQRAVVEPDGSIEATLGRAPPTGLRDLRLVVRNAREEDPAFALPFPFAPGYCLRQALGRNQLQAIRGTALCQLKGRLDDVDVASGEVVLVQMNHLLRDEGLVGSSATSAARVPETGEGLVEYVDGLDSVADAIAFYRQATLRFDDGQGSARVATRSWRPHDPFKGDTPEGWRLEGTGSAADLRAAVIEFIERHQAQRLRRHIRRGNLNGLRNFLDIFRTLNRLLFAYYARFIGEERVMPFPRVSWGVKTNLGLFLGAPPGESPTPGYAEAIINNLRGEGDLVRQRMAQERAAPMVVAAFEALLEIRAAALGYHPDGWTAEHAAWLRERFGAIGLPDPRRAEIDICLLEYRPTAS